MAVRVLNPLTESTTSLESLTKRINALNSNLISLTNKLNENSPNAGRIHSYKEITTVGTIAVSLPRGATRSFIELSGGGGGGGAGCSCAGRGSPGGSSSISSELYLRFDSSARGENRVEAQGGIGGLTSSSRSGGHGAQGRGGPVGAEGGGGGVGGSNGSGDENRWYTGGKGGSGEVVSIVVQANSFPLRIITASGGAGDDNRQQGSAPRNGHTGGRGGNGADGYARIWFYY